MATKIGRPIMLDTYTSTMCLESWGRNNYARALIEITSERVFVESLVVAIPLLDGSGLQKKRYRLSMNGIPQGVKLVIYLVT